MREGGKWLKASVVEKVGINIYHVYVEQLDVVWKRHANQLILIPSADNLVPVEESQTSPISTQPPTEVEVAESDIKASSRLQRIRKCVTRYGYQ